LCANQGAGPFLGPERGYKRGHFGYLKTFPLTKPPTRMHWYSVWNNLRTRRHSSVCK